MSIRLNFLMRCVMCPGASEAARRSGPRLGVRSAWACRVTDGGGGVARRGLRPIASMGWLEKLFYQKEALWV